jgi:exopolysaccharide biosynthesis polyprenyl glycosylphosphotransferase
MRSNASLLYGVFLIVGDFLALLAAFVAAYILRVTLDPRPLITQIQAVDYVMVFIFVLPLWILVHAMIGLYSQQIYEKRFIEFGRLLMGSFLGILVVIGYDFISDDTLFPARLVPVYALGLAFVLLLSFRSLARIVRTELFTFNIGITNILIVGNTPLSIELLRDLADTRTSGYRIVGVVSKLHEAHKQYPHVKVFDSFSEAIEKIGIDNIHSVIQTELYANNNRNNEILTTAQENHIAYRFVPGNTELFVGNIEVDLFHSIPVIAVHQTPLLGWGRVVKRLFDVIFGILLLIPALPVMTAITLLMILFDHGDPIWRNTRLSRYGTKIGMYKFRTQLHAYHRMSPEEGFAKMGKPELAVKFRQNGDYLEHDPRISNIGRFLRKTSLDELPQLFNVLKGDMSLVGPRPLEPFELTSYEKKNLMLSVKTGLTGLAVVSGRRDISFAERRALDLYYVQNWSMWLDLVILVKTIRVVLVGKGAK